MGLVGLAVSCILLLVAVYAPGHAHGWEEGWVKARGALRPSVDY